MQERLKLHPLKTIFSLFVSVILLSNVSGITENRSSQYRFKDDSVMVARIIDSYIQACGGDEIAGIKSESISGTMVRGITGNVPLEIKSRAPGRWHYSQTFAWGDQVIYCSGGETGWVQDTKCISDISPEEFVYFTLIFDPLMPLRIREFFPEMTFKGSEEIDSSEASVILAKSSEDIYVELAFDNETGLLLRAGDVYFEDYRKAGKLTRPYRILLGNKAGEDHPQMVMRYSEICHNIDIDDSIFEVPQCILPVKDSPIHRTWNEVEADTNAMESCVGSYQLAPDYTITFTREKDHLFFYSPGSLIKYEIRPLSPTDYFIKFANLSFHFIRNESGEVTHVEYGRDRLAKAPKIY